MKDHKALISSAVAGLLAFGISSAINAETTVDRDKCYGVSKAGHNACNSNKIKHSCAGRSTVSKDFNDYILLPSGSCEKIGGKLKPATQSE